MNNEHVKIMNKINTIMEYKLNTKPAPSNTIFFSVDENQTELLKL